MTSWRHQLRRRCATLCTVSTANNCVVCLFAVWLSHPCAETPALLWQLFASKLSLQAV